MYVKEEGMNWMTTGGLVLLLIASIGCTRDDEMAQKFASSNQAHEEKEAEETVKNKAETAKVMEEMEAARQKELAAAKAQAAPEEEDDGEKPEGNSKTTAELASNDNEKALLAQLETSDQFRPVAKLVKANKGALLPLIRKALRHEIPNVRAQAARVLVIRKDMSKATVKAWTEAIVAEADDDVLGLWAKDIQYGKTKAMVPILYQVFGRVKDMGAKANIAEVLMEMKHEAALPDVLAVLDATDDPMGKVFLISALRRMPHADSKPHLEKLLDHEKELVRVKAQELIDIIDKL